MGVDFEVEVGSGPEKGLGAEIRRLVSLLLAKIKNKARETSLFSK